jgi:hypothetical protein
MQIILIVINIQPVGVCKNMKLIKTTIHDPLTPEPS